MKALDRPRPGFFTSGMDPVRIAWEARWALQLIWTGAENLLPAGIQFPYCPAHSDSLYRLTIPAHFLSGSYHISFFLL